MWRDNVGPWLDRKTYSTNPGALIMECNVKRVTHQGHSFLWMERDLFRIKTSHQQYCKQVLLWNPLWPAWNQIQILSYQQQNQQCHFNKTLCCSIYSRITSPFGDAWEKSFYMNNIVDKALNTDNALWRMRTVNACKGSGAHSSIHLASGVVPFTAGAFPSLEHKSLSPRIIRKGHIA